MQCGVCEKPLAPDGRFCPACGAPAATRDTDTATAPTHAALEGALGGQYRILRLLGRGGMGSVYLAREASLDRLVAIKVLNPEESRTPESRERFRREARTAARLAHPSIVPLHAFGEAEDLTYFVMGYVRGESLGARLRREGKLPVEETRKVLVEIADALDYAHRQGVVHRDIKPDNVLLDDESGRAYLTDFGVAKAVGLDLSLTGRGHIVGTVHYMSPEQASAQGEIDGRSDLYSLGVMAYAMLSGRLPFEGATPQEVLTKHLTQEPPPLGSLAPDTPADILAAVTRCLAKDPALRWPDARSLREALARETGPVRGVPPELRALESRGVTFLVWLLASSYGLWALALLPRSFSWKDSPGQPVAPILKLAVLVLLLLGASTLATRSFKARKSGFGWRNILQALFRQPRWWRGWYPRAGRQPGDVWDRLPPSVKAVRALLAVGLLLLCAVFVPASSVYWIGWVVNPDAELTTAHESLVFFGFFGGVLVCGVGSAGVLALRFRYGFTKEVGALWHEPTMDAAFWQRPDVAGVLRPVGSSPIDRTPEPRTPHEYLRAIIRLAGELSGSTRPLASQAVDAARHAVSSLEALDRRVEVLGRDAGPAEAARIEARLSALAPESETDNEDQKELRRLLGRQLELIRGLQGRLQADEVRRARLHGVLRDLWLQVAQLHPQTPLGSSDVRDASRRMQALCAEIEELAGSLGPTGVADIETLTH